MNEDDTDNGEIEEDFLIHFTRGNLTLKVLTCGTEPRLLRWIPWGANLIFQVSGIIYKQAIFSNSLGKIWFSKLGWFTNKSYFLTPWEVNLIFQVGGIIYKKKSSFLTPLWKIWTNFGIIFESPPSPLFN